MLGPVFGDQLPVEEDAHAVVGDSAEAILARNGRHELARPARREVVGGDAGRWRRHPPVEVHRLVGARQDRRALEVPVRKELGLEAAQRGGRHGDDRDIGERRPRSIEHLRLRRDPLADARERCGGTRRLAVVVAEQDRHLVGVRADDGNRLEVLAQREGVVLVLEQHD